MGKNGKDKLLAHARGLVIVVWAVLALGTVTGAAIAQESGGGQPRSEQASVSQPAPSDTPAAATDSGSEETGGLRSTVGDLPFTGLDLLILAGLALVLFGTGLALRRLSAPRV